MDRKELKRQAMENKTEGGVFVVRNNRNDKVFVDTTPNFKTINGQQFTLGMGMHKNKLLQQEWNEFGQGAFTFEVLEVLEVEDNPYFNQRDALKKLKQKWLDQLQPYGDRGYN